MKRLVDYYKGLVEEYQDIPEDDEKRCMYYSNKLLWRLFITSTIINIILFLTIMKGN